MQRPVTSPGGPAGIRTHDCRIKSPGVLHRAKPGSLPTKQQAASRRPSPHLKGRRRASHANPARAFHRSVHRRIASRSRSLPQTWG